MRRKLPLSLRILLGLGLGVLACNARRVTE